VSTTLRDVPNATRAGPVTLSRLMASVQAELEQSEAILAELLFSQHLFLRRLARHIERFRGKRLRPALVHFAARVFGGEAPLAGEVAALVEMIHLASLCHDDILDEAATRRNVPTLNAQWGAQVAVVTGDLLLSRAFGSDGKPDLPARDTVGTDSRPFRTGGAGAPGGTFRNPWRQQIGGPRWSEAVSRPVSQASLAVHRAGSLA